MKRAASLQNIAKAPEGEKDFKFYEERLKYKNEEIAQLKNEISILKNEPRGFAAVTKQDQKNDTDYEFKKSELEVTNYGLEIRDLVEKHIQMEHTLEKLQRDFFDNRVKRNANLLDALEYARAKFNEALDQFAQTIMSEDEITTQGCQLDHESEKAESEVSESVTQLEATEIEKINYSRAWWVSMK